MQYEMDEEIKLQYIKLWNTLISSGKLVLHA